MKHYIVGVELNRNTHTRYIEQYVTAKDIYGATLGAVLNISEDVDIDDGYLITGDGWHIDLFLPIEIDPEALPVIKEYFCPVETEYTKWIHFFKDYVLSAIRGQITNLKQIEQLLRNPPTEIASSGYELPIYREPSIYEPQ